MTEKVQPLIQQLLFPAEVRATVNNPAYNGLRQVMMTLEQTLMASRHHYQTLMALPPQARPTQGFLDGMTRGIIEAEQTLVLITDLVCQASIQQSH